MMTPKLEIYAREMGISVGTRLRDSQHPSTDFAVIVRNQVTGNVNHGYLYRTPQASRDEVIEAAYAVAMAVVSAPMVSAPIEDITEPVDPDDVDI